MKIENAIEVKDVSMCFNLSREKVDSIKEYVIKALKRQLFYEEFWALNDVSFEIRKGDSVGLVGMNGSAFTPAALLCTKSQSQTRLFSSRGSVSTVGLLSIFQLSQPGVPGLAYASSV